MKNLMKVAAALTLVLAACGDDNKGAQITEWNSSSESLFTSQCESEIRGRVTGPQATSFCACALRRLRPYAPAAIARMSRSEVQNIVLPCVSEAGIPAGSVSQDVAAETEALF